MAAKKKTAMGPKAKLMKKNLTQLKAQAKRLKIKGFSTKKKEALVKSIMLAEARKKKSKSPKKSMGERDYTPTGTRRSMKRMAKKRGASADRVMVDPVRPGVRRRPFMSEYNGWKNYETWYVNLHFGDVFQDIYDEFSLEGDYDFIFYADYFKDYVEDLLLGTIKSTAGQSISGIQSEMINAFLSEVDYDEIAKHFIE